MDTVEKKGVTEGGEGVTQSTGSAAGSLKTCLRVILSSQIQVLWNPDNILQRLLSSLKNYLTRYVTATDACYLGWVLVHDPY